MLVAFLLHLHQPPTQYRPVLRKVTAESYKKIIALLKEYSQAKITLNITASLTERLNSAGLRSVLKDFAELGKRGQLEFTASAAYHPLLTELAVDEINRQVELDEETNRFYLGDAFNPTGFFPPELAVSSKVLEVIKERRYKWVVVEEGVVKSRVASQHLEFFRCGNLSLVPRSRELSLKIAFAEVETLKDFELCLSGSSVLLAMDGETFGHHRPGQLGFLEEVFRQNQSAAGPFRLVPVSRLLETLPADTAPAAVRRSSWGKSFDLWRNPKNPIHRLQWRLTRLALETVSRSQFKVQTPPLVADQSVGSYSPKQRQWLKARRFLDQALHSDQYWWASRLPYWHPGMVRRGAQLLGRAVLAVPDASKQSRRAAERLRRRIAADGRRLYGEKIVAL